MNANEPITGELRERIRQAEHIVALCGDSKDMQVRINLAWLTDKLDAIDSVHSQLERENESLRAVHAQLERENEDLHTKFVNVNRYAEHVERENESLKAELDRVLGEQEGATMPLLDMNDEPINIGDVMQMGNDPELHEVVGFYEGGFLAWLNGRFVPCDAKLYCHHQPDTWERIINESYMRGVKAQQEAQVEARERGTEAFVSSVEIPDDYDLVIRCKELCERTMSGDAE